MRSQRHRNAAKAAALQEIRHGSSKSFFIDLFEAIIPVVCRIRPAYLIDTVILENDELQSLIKALQAVRYYQSMSYE